jgi:hypothetical protein
MTALDVERAAPRLAERAAAQTYALLVADEIDRLNDGKFQEFGTFVKTFGVHTDLSKRIDQHFGPSAMPPESRLARCGDEFLSQVNRELT